MFKLSIEFKNAEELKDFVVTLGAQTLSTISVEETKVEEVKEEKPKASKAKAKAAPAPVVEEVEVIEEPKFHIAIPDAIKLVTEELAQLTALKIEGAEIAQHLAEIYDIAGLPKGVKISQLNQEQINIFIPLFQEKVIGLKGKKPAVQESPSFI